MTEKTWLGLILGLFLSLGVIYGLRTPAFEASDELWHYPMVRHLADGNSLPVQVFDPALAGPWKQEASQPPLYYALGAALTFWIDTSDMNDVRIENPHVDNGLITLDGNRNLVMHPPSADPWQGTLLSLRLVRLFSVILGTVTVFLTYRIARFASPDRPELALGAAAVNAFLPMFLFITGSVNNDNLAIMLASLAIFMMIKTVVQNQQNYASVPANHIRRAGRWLLLGAIIGLALLTKEGTFGLLPLAWGTIFVTLWQESRKASDLLQPAGESLRRYARLLLKSFAWFVLLLIPAAVIAGWWYARNLTLYGDLLGWNAFIAVLGQRGHPASLLQLWGERRGFMMAFWGLFGGVNVPMADWIYSLLNALLIISIPGFMVTFGQQGRDWWSDRQDRRWTFSGILDGIFDFVASRFALITCLLFAAAVIIGLIQWATTTWSSQGRLVFTALSALCTLFTLGLAGWLPQRLARWTMFAVSGLLLVISALAPFIWIGPVYQPAHYEETIETGSLQDQDVNYGDKMRLVGSAVTVETETARPGDTVWVTLEWEVLSEMKRDWSVFVHLIDPVLERPIAQRDMYPGQGLLLTSWLLPGQRLINRYLIQVPETAVAPSELLVITGFYDVVTGERLFQPSGQDTNVIAELELEAHVGSSPNPVQVDFEDQLTLSGFEISPRRAKSGENLELSLFLQSQQSLVNDYTIFAQVVDPDTTRWASHDLSPTSPTSEWVAQSPRELSFNLILDENTPPGLYPLIVGVYRQTGEGEFDRLQIRTADGRLTNDFLELTQIRVD